MRSKAHVFVLSCAFILASCGGDSSPDPSERTVTVKLKDGTTFTGSVVKTDNIAITLQDSNGKARTFPMTEVSSEKYVDDPLDSPVGTAPAGTNSVPNPSAEDVKAALAGTELPHAMPPVIPPNGVISAEGADSPIVSGSVVIVLGTNLAEQPEKASPTAKSYQLGGVSVSVNGRPTPLLYVSPVQINLRLPNNLSGKLDLRVTTPSGSTSTEITVNPSS